jgi:hypothetical protein
LSEENIKICEHNKSGHLINGGHLEIRKLIEEKEFKIAKESLKKKK